MLTVFLHIAQYYFLKANQFILTKNIVKQTSLNCFLLRLTTRFQPYKHHMKEREEVGFKGHGISARDTSHDVTCNDQRQQICLCLF